MPIVKPTRTPAYRRHKSTGRAVVTLNGRDHYLGRHGSKESKAEYDRLIGEWLAAGRQRTGPEVEQSVNELILAYLGHCEIHYRRADGTQTSELDNTRQAMRPLKELYGLTPAANFGPLALKCVRQRMIERGLARSNINHHVGRIKRMFRWAVENEILPQSSYHALQSVAGLQRGRSEARETAPIRPVAESLVDAAMSHAPAPVKAMIELQRLTGMRPGEVCVMRSCDLDTSGRVWIYKPESHKTEHHGHTREIYLGPAAQEILKPWLRLETQACLFSPAEAEEERNAKRRENRKSPMTPSQRKRKRKRNRTRPWGERYDVDAYRRAIQRACDLAFPVPGDLPEDQGKEWAKNHRWHPHQLRHNAATRLRREYGIELARIILGHSTAFTTEIYAEVDRQQAMEVIAKVG